jgi:hypothetical protein
MYHAKENVQQKNIISEVLKKQMVKCRLKWDSTIEMRSFILCIAYQISFGWSSQEH